MKNERAIIFSAPMVRAILEGRKTMTRRTVKPPIKRAAPVCISPWEEGVTRYKPGEFGVYREGTPLGMWGLERVLKCHYGVPGDRLWVRECWSVAEYDDEDGTERACYRYRATHKDEYAKWKPSVFIPRSAARINLEITRVRVERLWDITEEDAKAEGMTEEIYGNEIVYGDERLGHKAVFYRYWNELYGDNRDESWKYNPFVWVIEFRRI
jgi:hypothetical protein